MNRLLSQASAVFVTVYNNRSSPPSHKPQEVPPEKLRGITFRPYPDTAFAWWFLCPGPNPALERWL